MTTSLVDRQRRSFDRLVEEGVYSDDFDHAPAAKDFVTDAFAHYKFIAHNTHAAALFQAACVSPDGGFVALDGGNAAGFVEMCRKLRFWSREGA